KLFADENLLVGGPQDTGDSERYHQDLKWNENQKRKNLHIYSESFCASCVFFGPLDPLPPPYNGLTGDWNWYANEK
ncbi:MAG: hypothetical protein P8I81_08605, partial [Pseudomonadales bacterium]|nr:hypothetical protein [Pseudomonadales bacterium]